VPEEPYILQLRDLVDRRLAAGEVAIPILPDVAAYVLGHPMDPNTNIRELSEIIIRDQSMAVHVLRSANSAALGGRTQILSLKDAVVRLGFSRVREIALTVALKGPLFNVPPYERLLESMWLKSAACGAYGKEIARRRGMDMDVGFLCGLLHDIGRPVLLLELLGACKKLGLANDLQLPLERFGEQEQRAGEVVAGKWNLPSEVKGAIFHYRKYAEAPDHAIEARLAALADVLGGLALEEAEGQAEKLAAHPLFAELGFDATQAQALIEYRETARKFVECLV
jgi:HD-like signal output (HDOD) protein